jgi:hypothetical protein
MLSAIESNAATQGHLAREVILEGAAAIPPPAFVSEI